MSLHALNMDFPGPAPEPAEATERIRRLKTRRRDGLQATVVLCAALAAAIAWQPAFVVAAAAGLVGAGAVGAWAHAQLRDLLDEYAMYPCMSEQSDVSDHQHGLIRPDRLASLAIRLRELVEEGPSRAKWMDLDALVINARVRAVAPRLLAVADALERGDPADPVTVARLWKLVDKGITGPPPTRGLTVEQLDVILRQALWRMAVEGRPVSRATRAVMSDD